MHNGFITYLNIVLCGWLTKWSQIDNDIIIQNKRG